MLTYGSREHSSVFSRLSYSIFAISAKAPLTPTAISVVWMSNHVHFVRFNLSKTLRLKKLREQLSESRITKSKRNRRRGGVLGNEITLFMYANDLAWVKSYSLIFQLHVYTFLSEVVIEMNELLMNWIKGISCKDLDNPNNSRAHLSYGHVSNNARFSDAMVLTCAGAVNYLRKRVVPDKQELIWFSSNVFSCSVWEKVGGFFFLADWLSEKKWGPIWEMSRMNM